MHFFCFGDLLFGDLFCFFLCRDMFFRITFTHPLEVLECAIFLMPSNWIRDECRKNLQLHQVLTRLPAGGADVPLGVDIQVTGHHVLVHQHPALSVHFHRVPVQAPGQAHAVGKDDEVTAVDPSRNLDNIFRVPASRKRS